MKTLITVSVILFASIFGACSTEDTSVSMREGATTSYETMSVAPSMKAVTSESGRDFSSSSENTSSARIQINGNLTVQVRNISTAMESIQSLIDQYGGSITSSNLGNSYDRYGNLSALVPRESFYELIDAIEKVVSEVTSENINSLDVTEEFVDIEARLNVMKQTESRFIALLSDASDVEEIMSVEKELMRLRGDIDSLEGRIKYLNKTTDNAVLNIHITEEKPIIGDDWSFLDSLDNSVRNLISLGKNIANFLITIIVFSPILIVVSLISFFGYRIGKRYIVRQRK